jgi:hypothetical protein
MPGLTPNARARILERFVLETFGRKPNFATVVQQSLTIGGYQMRHGLPPVQVPVQPQAAIHGERHSRFSVIELAIPLRQRTPRQSLPHRISLV